MLNSGSRGKRAKDGTGILGVAEHFNQQTYLIPTVTGFQVTDISYNPLDDTAANTAGSQTIVINGSGFAPGATVMIGTTVIGSVTWLDSNRLTFTSPALSSGVYTIYVTNANGGTGILVQGLTYSGTPTFTVPAGSVGSFYETTAISTSVAATGDSPINYSIVSGSLPSGATLNSTTGAITGTAPVDGSSTTYTFQVKAGDADFQESYATFTLTINTDVVTFSSPANNTTYTVIQNSPISNVTIAGVSAAGYGLLYTTSGLPTGLSMNTSTGIISGTPTVAPATNVAIITATANTTNRIGTLYLNWTVNLPGDAFWKYASLLLSADTTTGNTYTTDSSTYLNDILVVGDSRPRKFNPFLEGYYSNFFDGSGDYLTAPANTAFAFGTGDFTIEFWTYPTVNARQDWIDLNDATNRLLLYYNGTNIVYYITPTIANAIVGAAPIFNSWNHIALVRSSGVSTLYLNGLRTGPTYSDTKNYGAYPLYIGKDGAGSTVITGYISNLRMVKGTALYTANTTPPTSPLTYVANTSFLTCQSNKLIDNSNNNITITKNGDVTVTPFVPFNGTPTTITVPAANNYSMYFDGTGDYLSSSGSTAFTMGTGAFTVEYWVYQTVNTGSYTQHAGSSITSNGFGYGASGVTPYMTTSVQGYISSTAYSLNTWNHIAWTRDDSGFVRCYLNGVLTYGPTSITTNITETNFGIGSTVSATFPFTGYLSNIRVLKGTALYTGSSLTVPTAPLTTIANTSLLICQANTVIDNSNNAVAITVNGDARPARNGPFANTTTVTLIGNEGSVYFDGNGDYLTVNTTPAVDLATGAPNWTVELWFYASSFASAPCLIQKDGNSGTVQPQYNISLGTTGTINGTLSPATSSTGNQNFISTAVASLNTWNHVAMVRNGNNLSIYLNGALVVGPTAITVTMGNNTRPLTIGANNPGANYLTGYISNVRITKGTALYTSAFVPSWAPLTPVANTSLMALKTKTASNTRVIVDESNYANNIITTIGNATLSSFSPFGSTWSAYFDGTGDYLSLASSASFNMGTTNFTVEGWYYFTALPGAGTNDNLYNFGTYNPYLYLWGDGTIILRSAQTSGDIINVSHGFSLNQWYHLALVKTGTSFVLYKNGVVLGSGTSSSIVSENKTLEIGGQSTFGFTGYLSNFRIVKDISVYTGNFTVPSAPLLVTGSAGVNTAAIAANTANTVLLTCNSNEFVDYAAANNFITRNGDAAVSKFSPFSSVTVTPASYSYYFDGTGDYLSLPSSSAFSIPTTTTPFTIEAWVFRTATGGVVFSESFTGSGTIALVVLFDNGTINTPSGDLLTLAYYDGSSWVKQAASSSSVALNSWVHIACVFTGSTTKIFVNGADVTAAGALTTWANTGISGDAWYVGRRWDTSSPGIYFPGYISNLRFVVGTAVYTSAFTPPTTPLTAIANTTLLTCQSPTFIDNSSNNSTFTVSGDVKPVIVNPFTDTVDSAASSYSANTFGSSVYFDGATDYFTVSGATGAAAFGTANFTIEMWLYTTSFSGTPMICSVATSWSLRITTAGLIQWQIGGLNALNTTTPLILNAWNHVAVVRTGTGTNQFTIYINGAPSVIDTRSDNLTSTNNLFIGALDNGGGTYFTGYMSNFRILKGHALYTGAFVPSNQPLPPTSNTSLLIASTSGPSVTDALRISGIETANTARQVANNSPYFDTYSTYFDGSGDYLTFGANQANLGLGTGDFTFEFWFNTPTVPSTEIDIFESQTTGSFRILKRGSSAGLSYDWYGGTAYLIVADASITTNTWHHVAVSRTSGTVSAYYDGTRVINQSDTTSGVTPTANYGVGGRASGANYFTGYISNMRLVKGTGLYSGTTITVPTGPLTAVSNTQLLISNTNKFVDGSNNAFTITRNGDVKISAFQPFVANNTSRFTSVFFPAKTDNLSVRPQPSLITFGGDFTVECWVHPTNSTITTWGIWDSRQTAGSAAGMVFTLSPLASPVSGSYRMQYYNGTAYYGTTTILHNQWTHVAWVRSGSTMTFYVNGVAGGTATISGTQTGAATTNPIYIGTKDLSTAAYGSTGYIADLRITNGYARTITVPTAPYEVK